MSESTGRLREGNSHRRRFDGFYLVLSMSATVVGLNLTDLGPDGAPDPITEAILELAVAAAKVVS
jgi:hypothetical protein